MEELDRYDEAGNPDEILEVDTVNPEHSLNRLCMEYNDLIPYAEGGRYYGLGYRKYHAGHDNTYDVLYGDGKGAGLDDVGYIIWMYRNIFGRTPCDMEDLYALAGQSEEVQAGDLQVGDICMMEQGGVYHFGMIGFAGTDNHVLVTHCDNTYSERFPCGAVRLSYIKSLKNEYYEASAPADFTYFFRIIDDWSDVGAMGE